METLIFPWKRVGIVCVEHEHRTLCSRTAYTKEEHLSHLCCLIKQGQLFALENRQWKNC